MRILALVPARGGSKRVPGKNIRPLGGRPLIVWSIEIAKDAPEICDIMVSTDDADIAEVARAAGALVPWLRPEVLATDTADSVDVCLHALGWYESQHGRVDGLILLQPTSPYRSAHTVRRGIDLFREHNSRPVIGVCAAESHPMWCFTVEGSTMTPFIDADGAQLRSQDLPPVFVPNGAFYLITPDDLRKHKSLYRGDPMPLVIDDPCESMDIDTEWDWKLAEAILLVRDGLAR